MYVYAADAMRVVDGDTLHARLDLGCDVRINLTLRLAGINAPEMATPEGKVARQWLVDRIARSSAFTVHTVKDTREKYGRYLAVLFDGEDNINAEMVAAGQAFPYDGHGPRPTGGT